MDVQDASGKVVNWGFEGWPPAMLSRRGATPQVLKPGVTITVKGYRARDLSQHRGAATEILLPGGKCKATTEDLVLFFGINEKVARGVVAIVTSRVR